MVLNLCNTQLWGGLLKKELFWAFEKDLLKLVKKIKLRSTESKFQKKLKEYIKKINNTPETLTCVDKISNIYKLLKRDYESLMYNEITTT